MIPRRDVLSALSAGGLAALADPRLAFARLTSDRRLVVVVLRGGMDGLEAVPPHGEAEYARLRPTLAVKKPGEAGGAIDLDGRFGLHPALAPLKPLYDRGELAIVHAAGSPDRTRSHFDAQDALENGTDRARGAADGWLNRALAALGGAPRQGLAVANTVPLILRGAVAVRTWAPAVLPEADAAFLDRLDRLYARDPALRRALAEGRASARAAAAAVGEMGRPPRRPPAAPGMGGGEGGGRAGGGGMADRPPPAPGGAFATLATGAGRLLAAPDGPRVATLEFEGWDTHFAQAFNHRQQLERFAAGLVALKAALGPAWSRTVVVAASEFGRTAAENGTRGTDHGTGGAAFILGGAVSGGRVLGRWPGLGAGQLFEGRDLAPTTDLRALFKGVLAEHLGLATAALEDRVFPASRAAPPLAGLVRRG